MYVQYCAYLLTSHVREAVVGCPGLFWAGEWSQEEGREEEQADDVRATTGKRETCVAGSRGANPAH